MRKFLDAIRESYQMLDLEDDWDDDGALKVKEENFNRALALVHLLASKVPDLYIPYLNPGKNGEVDIDFSKPDISDSENDYGLLIMVSENFISYFGGKCPTKPYNKPAPYINKIGGNKDGELQMLELLELIEWCKKYMTYGKEY